MALQTRHSYQLDVTINWKDKPNGLKEIESVERYFSYNGEEEYSDCIDAKKYYRSLEIPDVFRIVELFSMELSRIADNGFNPILIFDEAEYLNLRGLLSIKTIYDYLKDICAIVMIGTSDILNKLEKSRKKEGMPQFIRRFKAGIRNVRPIDRTFARFFEGKEIGRDLKKLLCVNADNYGELADFLEPAIREADRRGVPLTKEFFLSMFYLQNK